MTTTSCSCCGDKPHNPNNLIAYKVFYPGPEVPKADLIDTICDICGEVSPKHRKPIAARIVYAKAATGEFLRQDYRCQDCFEEFYERHKNDFKFDDDDEEGYDINNGRGSS